MTTKEAPFTLLGRVDTSRFRLQDVPAQLWDAVTWRQSYPGTAHSATQTIYLAMPEVVNQHTLLNDLSVVPCKESWAILHAADQRNTNELLGLIQAMMDTLRPTQLGRCMLVRLNANSMVNPHVDEGAYARHYRRVHLPLQTDENVRFLCDGELQHMAAGELWTFNHRATHAVVNESDKPRVHLILDYV